MTTTTERIKAQQFAGDFLKKIRDMPDAPQILRDEAAAILRHYPNAYQIELQAGLIGLAQTSPELHRVSFESEFEER